MFPLITAVMLTLSACSVLELFAPDKVAEALVKIETRYGAFLDKAIDYRVRGLLSDKLTAEVTRLLDRFGAGLDRVAEAQADAQNEAANLDQYIRLELIAIGQTDLLADYVEARQQALADLPPPEQLTALREQNAARRATWDVLIGDG